MTETSQTPEQKAEAKAAAAKKKAEAAAKKKAEAAAKKKAEAAAKKQTFKEGKKYHIKGIGIVAHGDEVTEEVKKGWASVKGAPKIEKYLIPLVEKKKKEEEKED